MNSAIQANRLINRPQKCANCVPAVSERRPIGGIANAHKQDVSERNGMVRNHGTGFVIRGSGVRAPLPAPIFPFKGHNLQASPTASDEIATSKCLLFCAHSARFQGSLPIYRLSSLPGVRHGNGVETKINPPSHASRSQEGVATPSKPVRVGPLATLQSHIDDPAQDPLRHRHAPLPAIQSEGSAA